MQKLNPRVTLEVTTLALLLAEPTLFANYGIVVATEMPLSGLSEINAACRLAARPFYAASSFGLYGFIFADLIAHTFVISREQPNIPTQVGPESPTRTVMAVSNNRDSNGKLTELVTKREVYTPLLLANSSPLPDQTLTNRRRRLAVNPVLACIRALWEFQSLTGLLYPSGSLPDMTQFTELATQKHKELQLPAETLRAETIRRFMQSLGTEISPVCAYLGGQLAQDIINVLSQKEQPVQNMLIFDGEEMKGPIYALHTDVSTYSH